MLNLSITMNKLEFYLLALTIIVVCCLILIRMLSKKINNLNDELEWLYKDAQDERYKILRRIDRSKLYAKHYIPLMQDKFKQLHPSCWRKQTDKELHDEAITRLDL